MIDTEDRHKNIHNLEVDDDGTYHYTDGNGTHFVETPPKRKKKISFFGGYDTSRMPKITNKKTEKVGDYVDPKAAAELKYEASKFEDPQVQSALKARGWSDEKIGNLISTNRDRIKNLARLRETVVTPNGVEIPLHAGVNIGDKTRLSGHANLGVGSYGLQMGGEKPWGVNLEHNLGNSNLNLGYGNDGLEIGVNPKDGQGLGLTTKLGAAGAGAYLNYAIKFGKGGLEFVTPSLFGLGSLASLGIGAAGLGISYAFDKVTSKFKNDILHGQLKKNPPEPIKKAWEIGLKNLSDDDIFNLVSSIEKTRDDIYKQVKNKNNGAYHYFNQELKHFHAERIRRGKKRWADGYVKNWAAGKHPSYEKFLREKLENDLQNPDVKKYIGEPHWNNSNDWGIVDRAKDWIEKWGATPNRLDAWHKQFLEEHKQNIENALNENLDTFSKGHPEGFREFLRTRFDPESFPDTTPEKISEMFSGLKENGDIEKMREQFDIIEAERIAEENRIKNSEEAKKQFGFYVGNESRDYHKDIKNDFENYLRSHFDEESLEYATKKNVDDAWGNFAHDQNSLKDVHTNFLDDRRNKIFDDVLSHLGDEPEFKNYLKNEIKSDKFFVAPNFYESGKSNDEIRKKLGNFFGESSRVIPTYRQRFDALQERRRREAQQQQQSIPTATPIPFANTPTPTPQPISDDVDIARHENEANGNFWSRYNPMPAFSSYFSKMITPNEDVDLKRFQNQYNNLAAKFSVPKHTPPQYFEDDPKDTLQDKISKFRLRYLQEARRMRPPNPEKLRGNKNNLGWTRDMINLVTPK